VATIYTIGHSTRSLDDLVAALQAHDIKTLIDIRAFPMSRRLPHFNRESLEEALPTSGIAYVWEKRLGGRRKKTRENSPNFALRNDSFRNYADYMLTDDFKAAMKDAILLSEQNPTAIMCAERVYFQCHRMLVSDWLALHGHEVLHIDATGPTRPHKPLPEARRQGDDVIYDGGTLF
jgi:uncharacterized protein (DUF488 family)